jgi:anti-anti-sigma factor
MLEATPEGVCYVDTNGRITFYNQRLLELWKLPDEVARRGDITELTAVLQERMVEPHALLELVARMRATGEQEGRLPVELLDGNYLECTVRSVVVEGKPAGRIWLFRDITDQRRAAKALAESEANLRSIVEEQQRLISTIQEIGTPVLPIYNQVLVLPLVGHLDGTRSAHLMDALLYAIQRYQAMVVIIDITGVSVVDTSVANSLIESTRAAALLGAHCVLVGISAAVARTIVHLGMDLTSVVTKRDLQAGVAYALGQVGCSIRRVRTEPDWINELLQEEEATRKPADKP